MRNKSYTISLFQADVELIREVGAEKLAEINKDVDTDVDLVYWALEQLRKIIGFENNGTTSGLVDFFRFCAGVVTFEGPSADGSSATTESNYSTIFNETSVSPFGGNVKLQESTSNIPNMTLHVATETGNISLSQMPTTSTQYESFISSSVSSSQTGLPTSNVNNVTLTANDTGSEEEEEEDYQYPWLNITILDQYREAYRKYIRYIDDVIVVPFGHIQQDQEFFILAEGFARSTENPEYTKQNVHGECFDLIEEGKEVMRLFCTLMNLVRKLKANDSKESVISVPCIGKWK